MDSQRLARQDLLRRRDISLYTGLHPRLLHAALLGDEALTVQEDHAQRHQG